MVHELHWQLQQPPVWWSRHKVTPPDTTKSFSLRNLFEGCITVTVKEHSGWMLCLRQKSQISPTAFHAYGKSLWILNETTQSKIRSEAETLWRGHSLGEPGSAALDFTRKVHSSDAGKRPCHRVSWRNDCRRDRATGALGEAAAAIASTQTCGSSCYCRVQRVFCTHWKLFDTALASTVYTLKQERGAGKTISL